MVIKMQASYIDSEHPTMESGPLPRSYRLEPIGECILLEKWDGKSWATLCDMPDIRSAGKQIRRLAGMMEISQASIAKMQKYASQVNGWIASFILEHDFCFPLFPGKEDACILFAFYDASWQEMGIVTTMKSIEHYPLSRLPQALFDAAGILDY